ncbi:MAG: hypothetical protein K9L72_03395 [Candidatus Omnitrophica bacterium]|nr:hypothetical protein [Candidatus Omnitrophota bacterium]
MDKKEKLRLQKEYKNTSDKELIDLLEINKSEFKPEIYDIIVEESKRRNLKEKIEEKNKLKKIQEQASKEEWATIYRIHDRIKGQAVENSLNNSGVQTNVFYHENAPIHHLYTPSSELGIIEVKKEDIKKAQKIIDELENKPI